MSAYVSSNDNRFYTAIESQYGKVADISGSSRIPAVRLKAHQQVERVQRRDKTGSRTFPGEPVGLRRMTSFALTTYLTGWNPPGLPAQGSLVQAALGAPGVVWPGGIISSGAALRLSFSAPHGLQRGQAIVVNDEIRFVANTPDSSSVVLNAPLSTQSLSLITASRTANYGLAHDLPSVSIFDYWNPTTAVQRALIGVGVNEMRVKVNSDFHELEFAGRAADLIDNAGSAPFPEEPANPADYDIVPGNLGQVWIGTPTVTQVCTLTAAEISISNDLDLRDREFGCPASKGLSPGTRNVSVRFSIFEQEGSDANRSLYQAARQRSPISLMFQLGCQAGKLLGVYLPFVIPEVPEFDDSERRLQWVFSNCRAIGVDNDELAIAFG